jgi:hypothetical protein
LPLFLYLREGQSEHSRLVRQQVPGR